MSKLDYHPNEQFKEFMEALQKQGLREWAWLIGKFRERLMPVLMARSRNIPSTAFMTKSEFAEEVFEECLLKFYELFENGTFNKYEDLEATIVRISDFKLMEGFAKIKRDQRLYFMDGEELSVYREKHLAGLNAQEQEQLELISAIRNQMDKLPDDEADLIWRYFNGEELRDIAADLNISAAACRKRKQRIIDKLRTFFIKHAPLLFLLMLK